MKRHYTYTLEAVNPIDSRKLYVGVRSCSGNPADDTEYLSSSRHVKAAIKDGVRFVKHSIVEWETRALAVEHEIKLHVDLGVVASDMYFNMARQTAIGWDSAGVKITGDRLQKMRETSRKTLADPEIKAKQKAGMKKANLSEETKIKRSETVKARFSSATVREEHSKTMLKLWSDPERRARLSKATKISNNSPEKRAAVSAANSHPCTQQRRESMRKALLGKSKSDSHRESFKKVQQLRSQAARFFNVQLNSLNSGMFAAYKRIVKGCALTTGHLKAMQNWPRQLEMF